MTEDRIVRLAPERDAPAALEACLMHAGALLGRPITLAALQVPQAGMGAGLGVREALDIARRAGLRTGFGRMALDELDAAVLPAILLMSGNRAVVAEARTPAGTSWSTTRCWARG